MLYRTTSSKIDIKTEMEINIIEKACSISCEILTALMYHTVAGISTKSLDDLAAKKFHHYGVGSAFYRFNGYPANICVSINDELVHGLPSKSKIIKTGDIVSIDVGVKYNGFYSDIAITIPVGKISEIDERLLLTTYNSIFEALKFVKPGNRIGDISYAVQSYVESQGFNVIREYAGHGIGRALHEKPDVPNYGEKNTGMKLVPGLVLAIEPMVTIGSPDLEVKSDGWTVVTKDHKKCAHYEVIVAITQDGYKLLTNGTFMNLLRKMINPKA